MNLPTAPPGTVRTRTVAADLDAGDGRTVTVRLLGWDDRAPLANGLRERFDRAAFTDVDPATVRLRFGHLTDPVGRGVPGSWRVDDVGPVLDFRVSHVTRGDDLLTALTDGLVGAASVEFATIPGRSRTVAGDVHHDRVDLRAVAIVDPNLAPPAYPSATVLAVRTAEPTGETMPDPDVLETRTDSTPPTPTPPPDPVPDPDPDPGAADRLETRIARLEARTVPSRPAPAQLDPVRLFHANLRAAVLGDQETLSRVLADVVGTYGGTAATASGLVPESWWPGGLTEIPGWRPVWDAAGKVPYPSSAGGVGWPVITQHTTVAFGTAQKAAAPTRALHVIAQHATPAYAKGAVDVAMELVDTSDPSALEVVWRDLVAQYMAATEQKATADLTTAATLTGAALPDPGVDYGAFRAAVREASMDIRVATGRPGDRLALDAATYATVADSTGSDGRPMFPAVGPSNVDGTGNLTDEAVNVGGVLVFLAPFATVPLMFNTTSAVVSERGPSRVQVSNVEEMGIDVGLIGPVYVIAHNPAGILKFAVVAGDPQSTRSRKSAE